MQQIASGVEWYGLLIVFLNALVAQGGIPVPAFPILVVAGAVASQGRYQIFQIIAAGFIGCMIADLVWYWGGKRFGPRVMRLVCKMSLSPDVCVHQTEIMFSKVGSWSLVFAKWLPALSTISVAMAGVTKMPLVLFLSLDVSGTLIFVSLAVVMGRIFKDEVNDILLVFGDVGKASILVVLAILALYLLARWWRRRLFIRQLSADRITVDELRRLIEQGRKPLILDVRPKGLRAQEGIIPGAVAASAENIDTVVMNYPRHSQIVVYCACPNEASAAIAAKHLQLAGFKKIRPLLGGVDAWVEAGQPLERPHALGFSRTVQP